MYCIFLLRRSFYISTLQIEKSNSLIDRKELTEGSGEKVCWVALLRRLRIAQGDIQRVFEAAAVQKAQGEGDKQADPMSSTPVGLCMHILRRSWDFMVSYFQRELVKLTLFDVTSQPAEVVRPLCMSTVFDIAVIA